MGFFTKGAAMIGKPIEAVARITTAIISTGCVLASAHGYVSGLSASSSSQPSSSRVILLTCTNYFTDPNGTEAHQACEYSTDGCPTEPPAIRQGCIDQQLMESASTQPPSLPQRLKLAIPDQNLDEPGEIAKDFIHGPK